MEHESHDCPFLTRLSGEVRIKIYEFVFENGSHTIDMAEAFCTANNSLRKATAAPSSTALMQTCHQINGESKLIFTAAYKRYWKKEFVIRLKDLKALLEAHSFFRLGCH